MSLLSSIRSTAASERKTIWTWLILGIAALLLGFFVKLTFEIAYEGPNGDHELATIDRAMLQFVANFRTPTVTAMAVDLTALGSTVVLTIFSIASAILLWMKRDRLGSLQLLVGSMGAGVFTKMLKTFFERKRPGIVPHLVDVHGFSYPSGHSLSATAIYLAAALVACRYFRSRSERTVLFLICGILISAIGFSRIYLGVHYPSDVVAGISFGAAWAFFLAVGMAKLNRENGGGR